MRKTIEDLRVDHAYHVRSAKELNDKAENEDRDLKDEEVTLIQDHLKNADTIEAEIKTREEQSQLSEKVRERYEAGKKPGKPKTQMGIKDASRTDAYEGNTVEFARTNPDRLAAFKHLADPNLEAYKAGLFYVAAIFGQRWAAKKLIDMGEDYRLEQAMGIGNNTNGGALVPQQLAQTIIDLREQYGVFERLARRWPMSSDTATIPRQIDNVEAYWVGESDEATESNPTFNNVNLVARKLAARTRFSTEIAEDAVVEIGQIITNDTAWAMAKKIDAAGFNGDGTSTYGGIVGLKGRLVAGASLAGYYSVSTIDKFSEVTATHLSSFFGLLPDYAFMGNPVIICSRACAEGVFGRLQQEAGGISRAETATGTIMQYNGFPIVISQTLPSTSGAINLEPMFYLGDLGLAATFGDRRQLRIMQSEHRYAELDQIGIFSSLRCDINVHDYGDTTNAGPVIAFGGATS